MTVPEKHNQTFEALRHTTAEGGEYWSARELFPALEYSRWEKFKELIVRLDELSAATKTEIPYPLAGLADRKVRFTQTVAKDEMADAVLKYLNI